MVLIIHRRSERRSLVNEKYTDGDLCEVSLQMTEFSSRRTVKSGAEGLASEERTFMFQPGVVTPDRR